MSEIKIIYQPHIKNMRSTMFTKVLTISIKKFISVSRTLQNELIPVLPAILKDDKKSTAAFKSKAHKPRPHRNSKVIVLANIEGQDKILSLNKATTVSPVNSNSQSITK